MSELLDCPFCGSSNIDAAAWASRNDSGPGCLSCGAYAESALTWNTRDERHAIKGSGAWVRAILGVLKTFPEWQDAEWGGDKEGWGFNFEFIKWLHRGRDLKMFQITCGDRQWVVQALKSPTFATIYKKLSLTERDEIHIRPFNLLDWESE